MKQPEPSLGPDTWLALAFALVSLAGIIAGIIHRIASL